MKLVSSKLRYAIRQNIVIQNVGTYFDIYREFSNSKAPLTDSQNRILDSKPMSMGEFARLMHSINLENSKK